MKLKIASPAPTFCLIDALNKDHRVIKARAINDPEFEAVSVHLIDMTAAELSEFFADHDADTLENLYAEIA